MRLNPLWRALAVLALGIVLLDGMGVMVRVLLARYSAPELSAWRNVIGITPSLVWLVAMGEFGTLPRRLLIPQWRIAFLRGVFVSVAQLSFYLSLRHLEFATASALVYTMSIFVVALSVPVLGERIGAFRWGAVLTGFAGAAWIIRPGSDVFSPYALLPLVAALLYASSSVTVRLIDRNVPHAVVYLYSASAAAVGAIVLALATTGFSPIRPGSDLLMILAMGLIGGSGVLCLVVAMRMVTPSLLAPFNYFGLVSSFTLGWLVFGEAPFARLFPGVFLIIGAGLVVIWRETRRARKG